MRLRWAVLLVALCAALAVPAAQAQSSAPKAGDVNALGHDVRIDRAADRVVVVGGDVVLGPNARVSGDVIVLFGDLRREPGARVEGSEYITSASVIDWVPGPGWVAGLLLLVVLIVYRVAVWAAVCVIAATLPRTALFERWARGWEPRPGRALAVGVIAVVIAVPALGVLALSGVGIALALLGLAGLLVAAGAGLAFFREGPLWPRRPGRLLYAAYLLLPPALEIGLLITAAGGLGAGIRAITRSVSRESTVSGP